MRPGARRADAQDIFLTGREALVEAVLHDVDGQVMSRSARSVTPSLTCSATTAASSTSPPTR